MLIPLTPTSTVANVAILIPQTSVQPRDKTATTVADAITSQPSVKAEDPKDLCTTLDIEVIGVLPEVTEVPEEVNYPKPLGDIAPAIPLAGCHIIAAPTTASPAVCPTAPSTVCLPVGSTDLITDTPPSSTHRTVLRSSLQP